ERRGIGRVEFGGLFPPVDRLAPETALCDVDAEVHLRPGVRPRIGPCRRRQQRQSEHDQNRDTHFHSRCTINIANIAIRITSWQGIWRGGTSAEQAICHLRMLETLAFFMARAGRFTKSVYNRCQEVGPRVDERRRDLFFVATGRGGVMTDPALVALSLLP